MPTRLGTRRTFLNEPYIVAIQEAGGIPLIVTPAHGGPSLRALFDLLDGLVLTGGEDVAPERYGEEVLRPNVEVVPERDALEFTLLEWALAEDLPVLAICRGVQVLNVALGGTLYQDLAADRPEPLGHDQSCGESPRARTEPHHLVAVRSGSALCDLLGAGGGRGEQPASPGHQGGGAAPHACRPRAGRAGGGRRGRRRGALELPRGRPVAPGGAGAGAATRLPAGCSSASSRPSAKRARR